MRARRGDGTGGSRVDAPTVVLLGGFGRSGTTLLERLLSNCSDAVAVGEVIHVWERGLAANESCGCGRPLRECEVWREVGARGFGGWSRLDERHVLKLRREVCVNRKIPLLLARRLDPRFTAAAREYAGILERFYGAVADVAGTHVLVDSSKHPSYAYLLRLARVRTRVVLVVRDSRGVAFSWAKHVQRPEVTRGVAYMPKYSVLGSALRWTAYNVLFLLLRLTGQPLLVLRYEQLIQDPAGEVERVLRFAGATADGARLRELATGRVELGVDHTVAGNPMRMRTGEIVLKLDEQWRGAMAPAQRRLVTLVTLPLQFLFGYQTWRRRRR